MTTVEGQQPHSTTRHHRETRLGIYVPVGLFVLALAAIILLVVVAFAAPEKRWGLSLLADLMCMVLILCPSMLCLGTIAVGTAVAAFKIGGLHTLLAKPLRRAQEASSSATQRIEGVTGTLSQHSIGISARMVFISNLLKLFDIPEVPEEEAEDD
jgi:hypothetical protein